MRSIGIIRGLGGNGSTFIARALAAMEGVVMLSETNPSSANLFAFALNPGYQIKHNYAASGLPEHDGNIVELGAPPLFGRYIDRLMEACEQLGRHLVIRDYNIADFAGTPFVWPNPRRSSLDAALPHLDRRSVVLVRHPVTQFLSLRAHPELIRALDYRVFLKAYRLLAETYPDALHLRYESAFDDFPATVAQISQTLGIPFDPGFDQRIEKIDFMTGNTIGLKSSKPSASSRSAREGAIRDLFEKEADYAWACERYGYER